MAIWLKEGKSESEIIEADEKVKRTVERILNDVSKRGDEAVRELSLKFDNYSPDNFILNKNEIENIIDVYHFVQSFITRHSTHGTYTRRLLFILC